MGDIMNKKVDIEDVEIKEVLTKLTSIVVRFSKEHSFDKNIVPLSMHVAINFIGNLTYHLSEGSNADAEQYCSMAYSCVSSLDQYFASTMNEAIKNSTSKNIQNNRGLYNEH
jgi:hypothetical protein